MAKSLRAKERKCPECNSLFTPFQSFQKTCTNSQCMISFAKKKKVKASKKEYKKETVRMKKDYYDNNRKHQHKLAVKACNDWIKTRDSDRPCISCGTTKGVQYAAGHYRTAGGNPELRFNESNIHKQCNTYCNNGLSGNIINYRPELIKKIGQKHVDWIEGYHKPQHLTIEDLKGVQWWFKELIKHHLERIGEC